MGAREKRFDEREKRDAALAELVRAVDFFDKVQASTEAEKTAVGTDHWDWLLSAARNVRKAV